MAGRLTQAQAAQILGMCDRSFARCLTILFQVANVGFTLQEPKEFVDDAFQVELFRRDKREPFLEVKTHLVAEYAQNARAGTVRFSRAALKGVRQEIHVWLYVHSPINIKGYNNRSAPQRHTSRPSAPG